MLRDSCLLFNLSPIKQLIGMDDNDFIRNKNG